MLIVTHSGKFHADDVFAVAVLDLLFPGCELIRTRDAQRIFAADFAVDVGGIWDPKQGRFDHHQRGFDGARPSGVVYASAGLVWREHGARCVSLIAQQQIGVTLSMEQAQQMAQSIDNDLVQYLDMSDTGAAKSAPGSYGFSAVISGFNPTWLDEQALANAADPQAAAEAMRIDRFRQAMGLARDVLINGVRYRVGGMLAVEQVRNAERLENGRLLLLQNGALPWNSVVRHEMPEVMFVIGYHAGEKRYTLNTVPVAADSFDARKDLPAAWAGLRDADLAAVTGVADALFCHNNLFIAAARSLDGILDLARQALAAKANASARTS